MDHEIFYRVEKKYLLNPSQYETVKNEILKYVDKDIYYKYTISNLYFDNDNYDLIRMSLDKPIYKEKLRLRYYGKANLEDNVYFEIKKKYDKVVSKRRIILPLSDIYNYLNNKIVPSNVQVFKEIDYMIKHYDLKPKVYLAYDREAYIGSEDKTLRITFDSNIRSRFNNIGLENGDYGEKLFDYDYYILEVKCLLAIPLWLVKILDKEKIYPTSFSKYGRVYEKYKEMI